MGLVAPQPATNMLPNAPIEIPVAASNQACGVGAGGSTLVRQVG